MDNSKDFKSIHIHNGCRNSKMRVVLDVPKRKLCESIAIEGLNKLQYLIDLNLSLIDAESNKASLFGKQYLSTLEHAQIKLHIDLNDLRIKINKFFLSTFIKISTKLNLL